MAIYFQGETNILYQCKDAMTLFISSNIISEDFQDRFLFKCELIMIG